MARRKRKKSKDQMILQGRAIHYCEICQRNYVIMATRMWRFVSVNLQSRGVIFNMVDHTQTEINFDAPAPTPTRQAEQPAYLILEMSKGAALGEPLQAFDKEMAIDEPIRLTEKGIWKCDTSLWQYPKGVSVRGKGEAVIMAEVLWRILLRVHAPNPSFYIPSKSGKEGQQRLNKVVKGLGKEYVRIEVNGKVEVKTAIRLLRLNPPFIL